MALVSFHLEVDSPQRPQLNTKTLGKCQTGTWPLTQQESSPIPRRYKALIQITQRQQKATADNLNQSLKR